jgi:outer membrane protein
MRHKFFLTPFFLLIHLCTLVAQEQISLQQFISLALEKNYDVKLANNMLQSVRTDQSYAWGAFAPQLNATGAIIWNNNNQEVEFLDVSRNNKGEAESNNTSASVQLNWVLFDGTKMFATYDRIKGIAVQGELIIKDQMVNTIATVINNYYSIVREKQQLKAITEQMAVSQERVKLAERKLEVGTGSKPELLQARVDYNAQRTQVVQQEAIIFQLKQQMNSFVGEKLPMQYDVTDTILINLDLKHEEIANDLENSNYALRALRMNTEIARLSLKERRAEMSPVISLVGAYNYSQTDNTKLINSFNPLYSKTTGYNYGFNVSMPIFNNFTTRKAIQQARIISDRQGLLYNQEKLNLNVALENAWMNYDNSKKVLIIEEENILLAKENVFIMLETFRRGVATFIELRTAQQSLADAYNRLITARYNAKVSETELLRLKGALLQ